LLNQMSGLMGRAPLFRNTFGEDRPTGFTFLIRPTLTEFNNFVQLLDKMLSDNINRTFFSAEVAEKAEIVRSDGKIEVRNKGTITLLEEWLNKNFHTADIQPIEDMIAVFKEVRQKRQKPAHSVNPNKFDQKYFHEQRRLMILAYKSVRTIRLIFTNWPQVRLADLKINEDLYKGNISNTNSIWLRRVWRHPWINLGQAVQYTTPSGRIGISFKILFKIPSVSYILLRAINR
jgi:hypothetical protein